MVQNRHAREQVALAQDKQKAYTILNGNFLCLSYLSDTFALQQGGFVLREWLVAKGLLNTPNMERSQQSEFSHITEDT